MLNECGLKYLKYISYNFCNFLFQFMFGSIETYYCFWFLNFNIYKKIYCNIKTIQYS